MYHAYTAGAMLQDQDCNVRYRQCSTANAQEIPSVVRAYVALSAVASGTTGSLNCQRSMTILETSEYALLKQINARARLSANQFPNGARGRDGERRGRLMIRV